MDRKSRKEQLKSNNMVKYVVAILGLSVVSAFMQKDTAAIYLIGDSTMSVKSVSEYPETGWGMPFVYFFDESVEVENHAMNGRSTKSFMEEGRWTPVVEKLKKGDWVFVQFGHNDEVPSKVGRYTTPEQFQGNLKQYVTDARSKGAKPILVTPVARRKFDEKGKLQDTHEQYSQLVREVAAQEKVPLVDLDKRSQELLTDLGPEKSKLLYLHLEPGAHPNYPDGEEDDTHFNELGARMMAQLVLDEIRQLDLELVDLVKAKKE